MPGPPCDAGRGGLPRPEPAMKSRSPGSKRRPPPAGPRARRRQGANQGTRRRGCGQGSRRSQAGSRSPLRLGRLAAPRPPTSASICRDLSRPWPSPSPDQLDSLTAQRRSQGPGQRARTRRARSLVATGDPSRDRRRVQHDQGRAALSGTGREPPGVGGPHGGVRGETDEVDGLEQCRDDALPATFRARAGNEDETVEIGSQLGRRRQGRARAGRPPRTSSHPTMYLRAARAAGSSVPAGRAVPEQAPERWGRGACPPSRVLRAGPCRRTRAHRQGTGLPTRRQPAGNARPGGGPEQGGGGETRVVRSRRPGSLRPGTTSRRERAWPWREYTNICSLCKGGHATANSGSGLATTTVTESAIEVVVRPAEVADAALIATSHVRSWQAGYADVISGEVLEEPELGPARAHLALADDHHRCRGREPFRARRRDRGRDRRLAERWAVPAGELGRADAR